MYQGCVLLHVRLQVAALRTMLTFVTAVTVAMHGMVLLLVIRGCYNIFIMSRSDLNQQAAKAVLTQIVNITFQRLVVGEGGQVRPITPPDLVSVNSARAEARRDALTAQQVIMSVWESVMPSEAPVSSFTEDVYNMPESDTRCVAALSSTCPCICYVHVCIRMHGSGADLLGCI